MLLIVQFRSVAAVFPFFRSLSSFLLSFSYFVVTCRPHPSLFFLFPGPSSPELRSVSTARTCPRRRVSRAAIAAHVLFFSRRIWTEMLTCSAGSRSSATVITPSLAAHQLLPASRSANSCHHRPIRPLPETFFPPQLSPFPAFQ